MTKQKTIKEELIELLSLNKFGKGKNNDEIYDLFDKFASLLKDEIKKTSVNKVVNGSLPKQRIEDFKEGENAGRESMRELALEIIDKHSGAKSVEEKR